MKEVTPIRRPNGLPHVRGEKPTRAGPTPRAQAPDGSAAGNRPWGGTSIAPQGGVTKWSVRSEPLRPRTVAWQRGALVPTERVARAGDARSVRPWDEGGQAHGSLHVISAGRGARRCLPTTTGSLTSSASRGFGAETARYKRQRNPVRRRRCGWPHLRLWRTQHPPVKARGWAERAGSAREETAR